MNPRRAGTIFADLAALCVIAAVVLYPPWRARLGISQAMDEGLLLVYPEQILNGRLPYRDFETVLGPGNFALLAGIYSVFGTNIFVERAVGLGLRLLIILSIFGIVRQWNRVVAVACAVLAGTLLACVDIAAFAWSSALAFALCNLWLLAEPESRVRCLFAGLCGAFAIVCRFDFGPAVLVSTLPAFLRFSAHARKNYLAGFFVGLSPLLLLTMVVGPAAILRNTVFFPMFYLTKGRHLPIASAPEYLHRLLWAHLIGLGIGLGAAAVAIRRPPAEIRNRVLLGVVLLALGCTHYGLQRFDLAHLIVPLLISLGILPLSIFLIVRQINRVGSERIAPWIAIATVVIAMQLTLPELNRFMINNLRQEFVAITGSSAEHRAGIQNAIFVEQRGRWFCFATSEAAEAAKKMLNDLDHVASPGQKLLVGPADLRRTNYCDTFVYHMLPQLRPATYYLEMNPMSANAPDSRLPREIESADWLVLNEFWDSWNEPNASNYVGPDTPNVIVRRDFDLWAEYAPYLIYRNKRLRVTAFDWLRDSLRRGEWRP